MIDFIGNATVITGSGNALAADVSEFNADTRPATNYGLDTASHLYVFNPNTSGFDRVRSVGDNFDAYSQVGYGSIPVVPHGAKFNGTSWDRERTQNIFLTFKLTGSGTTSLYSAASGNYWRLMGYTIELTGDAGLGVGADVDLQFFENATALGIAHSVYIPSATSIQEAERLFQPVPLGNGLRGSVSGSTLNFNISAALTAGYVRVNVALCTGTSG